MIYLTGQLNLNLQNGDRIEITAIATPDGGVQLGISAPGRKTLRKALAHVDIMPVRKGRQPEPPPPPPPLDIPARRQGRRAR